MADTLIDGPGYRSGLMDLPAALRWAKCIAANDGIFKDAVVVRSKAATPPECFFVYYAPVNEERRQDILERAIRTRLRRATKDGPEYRWDHDERGFWRLQSTSGNVYELSEDGSHCSCPDAAARMGPLGATCKHSIAFNWRLGNVSDGRTLREVLGASEAEQAEKQRRFELDWPE